MDAELGFEAALRQIEAIVADLERGEPELARALAKYEEGVRLLARCYGLLDRAEQTVALLTGVDEAGNPITAPFDAAATLSAPREPLAPAQGSGAATSPPSDPETGETPSRDGEDDRSNDFSALE
jgi:exodeoxyribonuclease VII small subunit